MIKLLLKKGDLQTDLPSSWEVKHTIFKEAQTVRAGLQEMMSGALSKPIGSPRLEELLKPSSRVAIVVDDLTRHTPISDLLPGLLKVIESEGVPKGSVTIVIGTGTHRPMDPKEIEARLGKAVASAYRVENHDARSKDLVVMGELPGYGKIAFNATVMKADVKVTVGTIIPHVHNGFGGGPKNIMPAVCNFDTIRKHHLKTALHQRARVGVAESNPFLDDLTAIARLAKVNFCVQCLNDSFGQVYDILAGDVFEVFRAGMERQSRALGVSVSEKTDVTVVSAFPYDEGVQIMKSFMPSAMVTKIGGSIFVVTELVEPLPGFFLDSIRKIKGKDECVIDPGAAEKLSRCEPLIEGAGVDFNMALLLVLAVAKKFNLVLIGHEVLKDLAKAMECKWYPDLKSALQKESKQGEKKTVSVIPAGGYIFPIIEEPFELLG
ncbi:MAG: lactate racemase domain-containing protein [Desulfobacterota bacterium]|nr:lactate racemase domain-containing protein [Thermodesulfobacteriota bacterium]